MPEAPRRARAVACAGALLTTALALGCSSTRDVLVTRFGDERACPEDQVHVTEEGGTIYVATGCGKRAEYVCGNFAASSSDARACEERNVRRRPGPPVDATRLPGPHPDVAPGRPHPE